jgi:UPF0716 protein FxsA
VRGAKFSSRRRGLPVVAILFVLITTMTIAEIAILILLADLMGWLLTLLFAVVTAIIGAVMIRFAGGSVWSRFQAEVMTGRFPAQSIAEGALVLVGGAFLITPGLITDLIGISTLIPPIRSIYARLLLAWARRTFVVRTFGDGFAAQSGKNFEGFASESTPRAGPSVFDVPPDVSDASGGKSANADPVDVEFKRTE